MRMLDLFCGRWGWSKAFAARGWECVGVDLVELPEIPQGCTFLKGDILKLDWSQWETKFDFICASSPCEQFSTMRNFRPPIPHPELGIRLFNHTREICEASGVPYVMENVAGAQRFVGKATGHAGSFYLWGNSVPPILPHCRKGMTELAMGLREHKGKHGWNVRHNGKKGQTDAAQAAMIPPELANTVADYAERLLEHKVAI